MRVEIEIWIDRERKGAVRRGGGGGVQEGGKSDIKKKSIRKGGISIIIGITFKKREGQ